MSVMAWHNTEVSTARSWPPQKIRLGVASTELFDHGESLVVLEIDLALHRVTVLDAIERMPPRRPDAA